MYIMIVIAITVTLTKIFYTIFIITCLSLLSFLLSLYYFYRSILINIITFNFVFIPSYISLSITLKVVRRPLW